MKLGPSLAALATVLFGLDARAMEACLKDDSPVEVRGVVSLEAFAGPPDYKSVRDGDALELVYVLTTAVPMNFCEGTLDAAVGQQRRFQLARVGEKYVSPIVFGEASARGMAAVGMTGHYHTAVAIFVDDLRNYGDWAPVVLQGSQGLLPITIAFRPARVGHSLIALVKNESAKALRMSVTITSVGMRKTRNINLRIAPFRTRDIASPFMAGDHVFLHSEAFTDVAAVVPSAQ